MECPVCHQSDLAKEATNCPKCESELKGFSELDAAEEERNKRKKSVNILLTIALFIGLGWIMSATMMSPKVDSSADNETSFQEKINTQAQIISDLQSEKEVLAMRNNELEEQVQSFEVIEMSEDGESIEQDYVVHVVKEGESLWSIAEEYHSDGFKHDEIAGHNELSDPHYIKVGDTVIIKK